jgi:hypothetical protein
VLCLTNGLGNLNDCLARRVFFVDGFTDVMRSRQSRINNVTVILHWSQAPQSVDAQRPEGFLASAARQNRFELNL